MPSARLSALASLLWKYQIHSVQSYTSWNKMTYLIPFHATTNIANLTTFYGSFDHEMFASQLMSRIPQWKPLIKLNGFVSTHQGTCNSLFWFKKKKSHYIQKQSVMNIKHTQNPLECTVCWPRLGSSLSSQRTLKVTVYFISLQLPPVQQCFFYHLSLKCFWDLFAILCDFSFVFYYCLNLL